MKISKEQLQEIITSHGKWLRNEEGGQRVDLGGAYLSGADLSGADLSGADLSGADLGGAYLRCADLGGADLSGADLSDADLRGADLRDADLRGADLRGADLSGADLGGADLNGAYLRGADLDKTYYQVVRIGSRKGTTTYCVDDNNVLCGCWNIYRGGTLEEFKQRVEDVYGEGGNMPNAQYYAEYMAAIKFFESVKELGNNETSKN